MRAYRTKPAALHCIYQTLRSWVWTTSALPGIVLSVSAGRGALPQVLGNVKGVVAVVASILWFRNPVNVASMMGYGITVAGVVAYSQVCGVGLGSGKGWGQKGWTEGGVRTD